MKLWIDAQLPPGICAWIGTTFSLEADHVESIGLRETDDAVLFETLRQPGNVLVTKDEDFLDLVTRLHPPPQVRWLRFGNCTNPAHSGDPAPPATNDLNRAHDRVTFLLPVGGRQFSLFENELRRVFR